MAGLVVGHGQPRGPLTFAGYSMAASQLRFDRYQFNRGPRPVSQETCIDYADYKNELHLEKGRSVFAGRRLETPGWARNDRQLLAVVVRFMEVRCLSARRLPTGTMEERLQRAIKRQIASKPRMIETLDGMAKRYVAKKNAGKDSASLKRLAVQIENLDTRIRFLGKDHLLALGVVYHYYRCGSDSVATGAALGIKSPHVRQILSRLNWAAAHPHFSMPRVSMRINLLRGLNYNPVAVPANGQRQCWVCGILFTPERHNSYLCSKKCRDRRSEQVEKARLAGKPAPPKYFCGPACKEAARFVKHVLPAKFKPGIGSWVPTQAPPGYEGYKQFCVVIGATPLPEIEWRMGVQ